MGGVKTVPRLPTSSGSQRVHAACVTYLRDHIRAPHDRRRSIMSVPGIRTWADTWADMRRAITEFLAVPAATVVLFIGLAVAMYVLDRAPVGALEPTRAFLERHFLVDPETAGVLLGTVAGGVITVTSITFSLLLLAVQQSAAAFTSQVLDQFLRRRLNQFYFGVFVGIALYALVTLATANTRVVPIFGSVVALVLTLVALATLVLLLYSTLNQMRPNRIVEAIHDLTLLARERQRPLLGRTRAAAAFPHASVTTRVLAETNGYLTGVHLGRIANAAAEARGRVEVSLLVSVGAYVCFHDMVAEVRAEHDDDARTLAAAVHHALAFERQRNLTIDPAYGVTQLATIGWTSVSSAKSDPAPGLAAVRNLRDLLARWSEESVERDVRDGTPNGAPPVPLVYRDDVLEGVLGALESVAVAAAESRQHQTCAEVARALAQMADRIPPPTRPSAERVIRVLLATLGDHLSTAGLDHALARLAEAAAAMSHGETAGAVRRARADLAARTLDESGA